MLDGTLSRPRPTASTQFLFGVLIPVLGLVDGRLNIEAMSPAPLLMIDDHWKFADAFERRWYMARGSAGLPSAACDARQHESP